MKFMVQLFSIKLLVLLLILVDLPGYAASANSQTIDVNTDSPLIEELTLLAQSDADHNINRRTEFVIELYARNSSDLTPQDIRKVYDDAFNRQVKQNEQQANARRIGVGVLGLLGLGAVTFVVAKRNILKVKTVRAQIPWVGEVEFETVENARNAAWKLYVEMRTRIATQQLGDDQGLLREALNSLYKLFELTREILKDAGPDIGASRESVGGVAIALLNEGLRPFTAKWHPKLKIWEAQRPEGASDKEHEDNWSKKSQMRQELKLLSQDLERYTNALAKIAGAPLLNSSGRQ